MRNDGDSKKRNQCSSSLPLSAAVRDVWVTWQHKLLTAEVPSAALKLAMYILLVILKSVERLHWVGEAERIGP